MPSISYLHPLDQPFGRTRSLAWLVDALRSDRFNRFRLVVAYAKEGAFLKFQDELDAFVERGGQIEAIFGIDQRGTSRQALEFAISHFARAFVWQHPNLLVTFHPKMYLFEGRSQAEVHIGSCNLTTGGLETNCEASVRLSFELPAERSGWAAATSGWRNLLAHPNIRSLSARTIRELSAADLLLDESLPSIGNSRMQPKTHAHTQFPSTPFSAPSPRRRKTTERLESIATVAATARVAAPSLPSALLIQVSPHHNGEVFLSMRAVAQYPSFFDFPFNGSTTPKKKNPPYPQRLPDPITDWTVYDTRGLPVLRVVGFPLNTVYYNKKSELRVTVSQQLLGAIPENSILQMTRVNDGVTDYACDVFPPDSPQFSSLLRACNQTMPSGGKPVARRFGWI